MPFKREQLINKLDIEEASQTMQHNLYADDLLKSVESKELAVRLIRDVKAMCQVGHFNKFHIK